MALKPVALVTGASSGVGYELAKLFAANDFDLLIAAEDAELDDAAEVLRTLGAGVESVRVDLTRPDEVEELWRRVKETGRPLAAAATMPGSFEAVYNASKSFDQSFALALREELKGTGVEVTSLMPGPTNGHDPAAVAGAGFAALTYGTPRIPTTRVSRVLPDSVKAAIHRRMAEPGSAKS